MIVEASSGAGPYLGVGMGWGFAAVQDEACAAPGGLAAGAVRLAPCSVLQGAKPQSGEVPPAGVSVGLDWIRMTGSATALADVREVLSRRFGPMVELLPGLRWYGMREEYPLGASLSYQHRTGADSIMVECGGSVLSSMSGDDRVALLRAFMELGLKPTRLDIAVDVAYDGVDLVMVVERGCREGNLCGARIWEPCHKFDCHGAHRQAMVRMGARGKDGGGRFVRVYDKGLERGTQANQWHRWELEASDDVAEQVASALLFAAEDWTRVAAAMALGAVDFREGSKHQEVSRRGRVAWWASFLGLVDAVCVRSKRRLSTAEGTVEYFRKSVAPLLVAAIAEAGGRTLDVVEAFCRGVSRDAVRRHLAGGRVGEVLEVARIMRGCGLQRQWAFVGGVA
jgi:hypothetical protein